MHINRPIYLFEHLSIGSKQVIATNCKIGQPFLLLWRRTRIYNDKISFGCYKCCQSVDKKGKVVRTEGVGWSEGNNWPGTFRKPQESWLQPNTSKQWGTLWEVPQLNGRNKVGVIKPQHHWYKTIHKGSYTKPSTLGVYNKWLKAAK